MKSSRLVTVSACIALVLVAVASGRSALALQPPCSVTVGNGAPPLEVDTSGPGTCGFLQFSWRAFLAMNWPALDIDAINGTSVARGLPDHSKVIGQNVDNETVWEQYQPNWYVFTPNNPPPQAVGGQSFAGWNQHANLASACGPKVAAWLKTNAEAGVKVPSSGPKILSSLSKFDPMPGVGQAFSAPLIDQQGYYARYEIRLSYETFNYINANQFYLQAAQLGKTIKLPEQHDDQPGAIFLKAAWKVLSTAERQSGRFHTVDAFMFTPATAGLAPTCAGPVPVGLVGLHIVQKTTAFPRQIWATFEQIDNVPDDPANPGDGKWSFFDRTSKRPANVAPKCPAQGTPCDWQPTSDHRTADTGPTQVHRLNPIAKSTNQPSLDQINAAVREALIKVNPKSVWQFYRLVEAQWQVPGGFFPKGPVANVTMETYHQKKDATSSCMDCHKNAKAIDNKSDADFTFELQLAWKPVVLPPAPVHHD